MNEKLFDSFPSKVMDEMLLGGSSHRGGMAGPNDPQTYVEAGVTFVDGMRVRGMRKIIDPARCQNWLGFCDVYVARSDMGVEALLDGSLAVAWDSDARTLPEPIPVLADALQIVPPDWGRSWSLHGVASNLVAGVDQVADGAARLRDVVFMRDRTQLNGSHIRT